jgi:hypothetical protein
LQEIAKLTPSRLFGFGGFREKPTPPFDSYRSYAYDFEHYFKLNDDIDEFVRQVNATSRKVRGPYFFLGGGGLIF